jgi:hypothetical protein
VLPSASCRRETSHTGGARACNISPQAMNVRGFAAGV